MKTRTFIIVRFDVVGYHNWPTPEVDVGFLEATHRHIFKIAATAELQKDRGIEFFRLQRMLKRFVYESYPLVLSGEALDALKFEVSFGTRSCERIAKDLLEAFTDLVSVEVSEDGENASVVRKEVSG